MDRVVGAKTGVVVSVRPATSRASTPAFALSCSTARFSTLCARPRSSSRVPLDISRGVPICWLEDNPNMTETTKLAGKGENCEVRGVVRMNRARYTVLVDDNFH